MRLINTSTVRFQEFLDSQRPQYAILSHTWGEEELSYLGFLFITSDLPAEASGAIRLLLQNPKKDSIGLRKVEACCKVARERGYEWVWIDSCCIDKSSSAELSEAINSMWSWYRDAAECYVYLSDVPVTTHELQTNEKALEVFRHARWFSRGWTLQELLAPKNILFYNNRWEILATKVQICRELSKITNIPPGFLDGTYDPTDCKLCSAAMKMSWLSRRKTTKIEDMAYCMLGLFDVHLPLIYGEGRKAFMRLQLEIIKKIDDDSIYAWKAPMNSSGLLATWPTAFADSGNIVQFNFPDDKTPWLPPAMTSLGLEMRTRYTRHDPHQQSIDAQHSVHTISTALGSGDETWMAMHCGPVRQGDAPVTRFCGPQDRLRALVVQIKRFSATWQRVNCGEFQFAEGSGYDPSRMNAYLIYYVEQQGF